MVDFRDLAAGRLDLAVGGLAFAVGGLVALAAASTVALWRALDAVRARPPRGGRRLPAMLVIRPVRGLEPGLDGNVAAALAQRYPGRLETIFVLDDPVDPAYPVLRERLARAPGRARIVFAGPMRPGLTGELHAMIQGVRAAREPAPLVCFADSDARPRPTLLASLARAVLAAPDIGAAFAPAVSVAPPRTAGTWATGSSGTASTGRRPRWRWSAPAPCRSSWGRPWCSVAALSTRRAASAPPRDSPWTTWTSARAWPTPGSATCSRGRRSR